MEQKEISPEEAKFWRDKHVLEIAPKVNDKATAVIGLGVDPKNYDKIRGVINKEKIILMPKFSPVPYAKKLLENNKFIYDKYKRFWRYDFSEGIWKEDAEEIIRFELRKNLF